MIRLLVSLGKWLDRRFPEKLQVSQKSYDSLREDIQTCLNLSKQIDTLVQRVSVLEQNSVHKLPVQELVGVVKVIKEDLTSLKASMGLNRINDASIRAMLNGEPIGEQPNV